MAAGETGRRKANVLASDRSPPDRQCNIRISAACTTRKRNALFIRIHVEHSVSLQHGHIDRMGTSHIRLLRDRANEFKSRVLERGRVEQRKRIGKRNAVVRTERGAFRAEPVAVNIEIQPLLGHILLAVRRLLRDHIHVSLEDNRRFVLIACGGLLDDNHIVLLIGIVFQASLFCKALQICADFLLVMGWSRNSGNFLKKSKYFLRFQFTAYSHCAPLSV